MLVEHRLGVAVHVAIVVALGTRVILVLFVCSLVWRRRIVVRDIVRWRRLNVDKNSISFSWQFGLKVDT